MPIMSDTTSVAAGATSANVLLGEALALLPFPALVKVEASTSAAAGEMTATFKSGLTVHADAAPVNPAVAAGVLDAQGRDTILPGEKAQGTLDLRFTSGAAGATNATWRVTVAI